MPVSEPLLWKSVRDWPLPHRAETDNQSEPPRTCRRFEHNLRKIGDWTDDASREITKAYRKFIYLKALTGETLTPPEWIDQAWHLHMTFAADYHALETAVGRPIVHRLDLPAAEADRSYQRGWELWHAEFDAAPPDFLWPTLLQLRHARIGGWIAIVGFVVILGFVVASAIVGQPLFWIAALGFVIFLGGGIFAGDHAPKTISRCG